MILPLTVLVFNYNWNHHQKIKILLKSLEKGHNKLQKISTFGVLFLGS